MKQTNKKPRAKKTPAQRIIDSLVMVERDDETMSVNFKDKGLKIDITKDYAIISTMYHKHIFDAVTSNGESEVYTLIKQFTEIALESDIVVVGENDETYHSYQKLSEYMESDKANREDYVIFQYCDMWLFNIYQPLNTLQSNTISSFIVFMNYITNLANSSILLKENKKDLTNKEYVTSFINTIKQLTKDIEERVVIYKTTDEELLNATIDDKATE